MFKRISVLFIAVVATIAFAGTAKAAFIDGGLFTTICEMAFAGRTGVTSTGAGGVKSNVGARPATNGVTRQGVKKVSTTVG